MEFDSELVLFISLLDWRYFLHVDRNVRGVLLHLFESGRLDAAVDLLHHYGVSFQFVWV